MKTIKLILMAWLLMAACCEAKYSYTIKVTYTNGDTEEITYKSEDSYGYGVYLDNGCLRSRDCYGPPTVCGVRSYKIINENEL